jgi:hypothetical protein
MLFLSINWLDLANLPGFTVERIAVFIMHRLCLRPVSAIIIVLLLAIIIFMLYGEVNNSVNKLQADRIRYVDLKIYRVCC